MAQINEMIIAYNTPGDPGPDSGREPSDASYEGTENSGTIILDATCSPQNISYPQDVNLLNEARENLEGLIDRICYDIRRDMGYVEAFLSDGVELTPKQAARLIVRGKAAAPVEFGARLDLSIDENGMARLERLSFDGYNESVVLIGTIERYKERICSGKTGKECHLGNECRPPCVSFVVAVINIITFKVQTAWIYADIYAK